MCRAGLDNLRPWTLSERAASFERRCAEQQQRHQEEVLSLDEVAHLLGGSGRFVSGVISKVNIRRITNEPK